MSEDRVPTATRYGDDEIAIRIGNNDAMRLLTILNAFEIGGDGIMTTDFFDALRTAYTGTSERSELSLHYVVSHPNCDDHIEGDLRLEKL